jgi:hypothetical protein
MKNLISLLRAETTELKKKFVDATIDFSKKEYKRNVKLSKLNQFELGATIGLKSHLKANHFGETQMAFCDVDGLRFWSHKASLKLDRLQNKVCKIAEMGQDKFTQLEVDNAIEHYDYSIVKLATRVSNKGLDLNNLKMETTCMNVNIETIISDGEKTVKAFTIIASGIVQKPHYRYLVK